MKKISWNYFEARPKDKQIKYLIIHSFAFPVDRLLQMWEKSKVSAHYLIDENGNVMQLVSEDKVAYHTGKSYWNGGVSLNYSSIGIELYSPSFGQDPYPEVQINALKDLATDIIKRNNILPENVLGHSDVAPLRKVDPGRAFPWQDLSKSGVGLWIEDNTPDALKNKRTAELLSMIGYDITDEKAALLAFLRHFLPEKVSYEQDVIHMEDTLKDRIESCPDVDEKIKDLLEKVAYTYQTKRGLK